MTGTCPVCGREITLTHSVRAMLLVPHYRYGEWVRDCPGSFRKPKIGSVKV